MAVRYHPLSGETHEPGHSHASGQVEIGLMPLRLEPVTASLPTARLAVGPFKCLRPTQWFPSYLGLE